MERYDSPSGVLNAPVEDLEKVEGIGGERGHPAVPGLPAQPEGPHSGRVPGDHPQLLRAGGGLSAGAICRRAAELVFLLCLDRKGRLLACKRLAEGDVASADLNIRKVVEMALLTSASAVILAHNHPSGVAVPSSSDEAATRQVAEALRTIGVRLVDHIVVADRDFVSMADSGDLLG